MFKVGDKVKIREDLKVGRVYGGVDFIRPMIDFLGKEATITNISIDGAYLLDIDDGDFYWSTEMLIKAEETFKVGDKINIRKDLEEGKFYGRVDFMPYMREFLGKEATITDIVEDGYFSLDIDCGMFLWSTGMFESKTESKPETSADIMKETVNESEVLRLSKAVIEYENIVHELESEVDYYETKYTDLVEKYNVLVEKYNSLLEELKEDYI